MNDKQLSRLVAVLESVRERPAMYFGKLDPEAAAYWLHGFDVAVQMAFDIDLDYALLEEVLKLHGLELSGLHPKTQMARRGISPKIIIDELLVIEIELLQRVKRKSA